MLPPSLKALDQLQLMQQPPQQSQQPPQQSQQAHQSQQASKQTKKKERDHIVVSMYFDPCHVHLVIAS